MWFPVPFVIGNAFEGLASALHLLVELTKHHLSNGHDFLPCGIRDSGALILGEQKANCQAFPFRRPASPSFGPPTLPCLVARTPQLIQQESSIRRAFPALAGAV